MSLRRGVVAVVSVLFATVMGAAAPASAAPDGPDLGQSGIHATGWYVALGDSLAAGYQPDRGADPTGGYVGHVLDALHLTLPKTQLENLACPGETSVTMTDGGVCSYPRGSQLAEAVHFLAAHGNQTRLVTLDIGGNDVQRCVRAGSLDLACVQGGLAAVVQQLPQILGAVHAAAPHARIVVLNYYDPFLAAWLTGPAGRALAQASVALLQQLNSTIGQSAAAVGGLTADVASAFRTTDFTDQATLPGIGTVPLNVALICSLTWMCVRSDIHANDAGYAVMGATVVAALKP
jgi:lysophospholipase L1-like esterase